jgi:hypothetical protein
MLRHQVRPAAPEPPWRTNSGQSCTHSCQPGRAAGRLHHVQPRGNGSLIGGCVGLAGKRRLSESSRKRATGAKRESAATEGSQERTWGKATVAWVGGLLTAIVTGVAVALSVHFSDHVVDVKRPAAQNGPPITIQHVSAAPIAGDTFAFPEPLNLPHAQLEAFDNTANGYMPGWVGKNQDYPWAWEHGGAAVDGIAIKLDVRGNRNSPVRIESMQLAEQCRDPLKGTLFYSPSAGGGAVMQMLFNLDKVHPIAQLPTNSGAQFGKPYFLLQTITLASDEQQQIQLVASTQKHYCEFRIDMAVLDGTNIVHEMINNGKRPFRVTASIMELDPLLNERIIKYRVYQRLYVGGVASVTVGCNDKWVKVNQLTYSDTSTTHIGAC